MSYAIELHVSPAGNDNFPGTIDRPLKSIAEARDVVRNLKKMRDQDVIIYLHEGVYTVKKPIVFLPKDSGKNGHKVIFRSFKNDFPVLTGGITVTDWKIYDQEKNIYFTKVPKIFFRQLYINNKPAIRARTPNRISESDFGPYLRTKVNKKKELVIKKKDWQRYCGNLKKYGDMELVIESHWYHQRIHVGRYKYHFDIVTITPAAPYGKFNKKKKFYDESIFFFENALEFIDQPYEWYHNPETGILYLACAEGIHPNQLHIEVPVASSLIEIKGTGEEQVHDIEFQGITFQCSSWNTPSVTGLNATQFVQPVGVKRDWENSAYPTGIIRVAHARKVAFRNNIIRNTGAHGIQFFMNVDDSDIEENQFYQIAANGIEIDTHGEQNPDPDKQSSGVAIWNNIIQKTGQSYTNGGAVIAQNVRRLTIDHNEIYDLPYSAIQVGGQVDKIRYIGCKENLIRFNHIHHCLQLHDDGGGIYTLGGVQGGSVILKNYIHDIERSKWSGHFPVDAIYLDNFTSKILVVDNVVGSGKAVERNGAMGNFLMNNIQTNQEIENNSGKAIGYSPRSARL